MTFVSFLEFFTSLFNNFDTAIFSHGFCTKISMGTGSVPVSPDRLGVKGGADVELLALAQRGMDLVVVAGYRALGVDEVGAVVERVAFGDEHGQDDMGMVFGS